jgi:NTE family protein
MGHRNQNGALTGIVFSQKYPFRNLVFQGGGVKTLAYQGALAVLEKQAILPQIERVAGASAGALVAMLVSLRLSVTETIDTFNSVDFSRIPTLKSVKDIAWQPPKFIERELDWLTANFDAVRRLAYRYGWYANDWGYNWLQETIAAHCHGNGRATFADFRTCGFRDLHVVATNISQRAIHVFSVDSTPDVAVADALLMSQSLPIFFEAVQFDGAGFGQGDFYGDGGILNNYPIQLFDTPAHLFDPAWFVNGVNWETLGCRLYTPPDCPGRQRPITSLISYIANLLEATILAQDVGFDSNQVDKLRTISINNRCVLLTDFHVNAREDVETYQKLVASGREAAEAFLTNYRTPTANQLAKLRRILDKLHFAAS